jgi:hypothetical protein
MVSSRMLRGVAPVRTYVLEELSASIIRVTGIGELRTALAATSNRRKLRRNRYEYIIVLFLRSVRRLLVTTNVVPSSLILVTLLMDALHS